MYLRDWMEERCTRLVRQQKEPQHVIDDWDLILFGDFKGLKSRITRLKSTIDCTWGNLYNCSCKPSPNEPYFENCDENYVPSTREDEAVVLGDRAGCWGGDDVEGRNGGYLGRE